MSFVVIPHHNEIIYDIAKKDIKYLINEYVNPDRIKIEPRKRERMFKCKLKKHATLGKPEEEPPDPSNFLKKGTGKPVQASCYKKAKKHVCARFPSIPKEPAEIRPRTKVNFVAQNVKTMTNMKAKEPVPRIVFHSSGASKPLQYYQRAEEYGQVPKYLVKLKSKEEVRRLRQKESFALKQPLCRYITSDEREALLEGLKENWEEMQIIYQGLPIFTDTIPKINKKVKLENALKQLENDIVLVEKHPFIYVYKDNIDEKETAHHT